MEYSGKTFDILHGKHVPGIGHHLLPLNSVRFSQLRAPAFRIADKISVTSIVQNGLLAGPDPVRNLHQIPADKAVHLGITDQFRCKFLDLRMFKRCGMYVGSMPRDIKRNPVLSLGLSCDESSYK